MHEGQIEELVRLALDDDLEAADQLFQACRPRLKRMIVTRMDKRIAGRVDPSDVVQETLLEASKRLADYANQRSIPFYPWLRQVALNRLTNLHRRHVLAQKRSVLHEQQLRTELSDQSVAKMADVLAVTVDAPSAPMQKEEALRSLREALHELSDQDREVLMLIYLEEMTTTEAAVVLAISGRSVRRRHRVAVERLAHLLARDVS